MLNPWGLSATGWGSLLSVHGAVGPISGPADVAGSDPRVVELLFHELLDRGIYMARRGFIALSLAITATDLEVFLATVGEVVADLADRGVLVAPE